MRNRLSGVPRKATLADVAARAGVSTSTASRALSGDGRMTAATRAAVVDAASLLNFHPSPLARSLRTQRTFTVGLVVPDVASPFYAAVLKGAQGTLERKGYRVMLMDVNQDAARELSALETLLAHQVDGLLLASVGVDRAQFDDVVRSGSAPVVLFDGIIGDAGDGAVILDNERGISLLVEHLVAHGHSEIAFLAGPQRESAAAERLKAFRRAAARHGVLPDERHVKLCNWEIADGRRAGRELFADPGRPAAVIASSAELALGLMAAAVEERVRIPDDIALVAFDDPYFGDLLNPPLTGVSYDPALLGSTAAELLVDAMSERPKTSKRVRIPVEVVRRRSCGCLGRDGR